MCMKANKKSNIASLIKTAEIQLSVPGIFKLHIVRGFLTEYQVILLHISLHISLNISDEGFHYNYGAQSGSDSVELKEQKYTAKRDSAILALEQDCGTDDESHAPDIGSLVLESTSYGSTASISNHNLVPGLEREQESKAKMKNKHPITTRLIIKRSSILVIFLILVAVAIWSDLYLSVTMKEIYTH